MTTSLESVSLDDVTVDESGRVVITNDALAAKIKAAVQASQSGIRPDFLDSGCVTNNGCTFKPK